tara:strand:+ start:321 stop:533 length:213 start_codon:yes stop_codon:yes gene_type:complete
MFSKNYGQIIIGYGLLSIGLTLLLLFIQTSGIFWLILGTVSLIVAIWIIKKERKNRDTFSQSDTDQRHKF